MPVAKGARIIFLATASRTLEIICLKTYDFWMILLQHPSENLADSYLDFIEEMRTQGEKVWEEIVPKNGESLGQFVERMISAETSPRAGLIAETTYWATANDIVVGRIALRHALNENLKEFGGHIGYEVRPSYRKQGIAKKMLEMLLETPKAKEIGDLLLTCAPDNVPSYKTIVANGGILIKTAFVEKRKRQTNYYSIRAC